ncbi:non-ribosomal peptide synthetase [Saccharothrix syringae]|uniref:Amino acid adenylation domain-containing protein n=1 Tax=Saccharothrix syringae TaxID=103733 RepID=A0A5Q0H4G1_SACSY|nr:non-ribosomal peptide synthetase [Saccharothrix syringae]QFZ21137.1 amino acid adenylation domain-containing protein [Saccharothrix syringae]
MNTVHEFVAAHARTSPSRTAVVSGTGSMTYAELDRRAGGLAAALVARGVRPGSPVCVLLPRSAEFVVAALAVLKVGGHYVPLDPDYPTARLVRMAAAVRAPVVVTDASLASVLDVPAVLVDGCAPARFDGPIVPADELAYVMFTSGSTGVPKGVAVTHRGIVRLVRSPGCVTLRGQTMLHISSPSFDAATFDIWGALANGGRLVVGPPGKASVAEIGGLVRGQGVTTAFFPTGLFHLIVDEDVAALAGLRQVVVGGDVLSAAHARRFLAAVPGCRLVNGYGPTEMTTFTTFHDVRGGDGPVPIGTPLNRTTVRVLDDSLDPVPFGTPGQLYAGGDGLARGYLGDPALTAERFVPDPWVPGARLYATGDLVRETVDGLEFLGRIDGQVKKRGFRVEPGEVEAALRDDRDVRDAAVVATGERADTRRLEAFLVLTGPLAGVRARVSRVLPEHLLPDLWFEVPELPLNPNGKVDRAALRSQPQGSAVVGSAVVGSAVVGSAVVGSGGSGAGSGVAGAAAWGAGPGAAGAARAAGADSGAAGASAAGAAARGAGSGVAGASSGVGAAGAGAAGAAGAGAGAASAGAGSAGSGPGSGMNPTENTIAAIWRDVLEVEEVGRDDDFFALGGHSLIANRIVTRMRKALGVDLRLVVLFDHPTVAGLARVVDASS